MNQEIIYSNDELSTNEYPELEARRGEFDEAIIIFCGGLTPGAFETSKTPYISRMREFTGILEYYDAVAEGKSPVIIATGGCQDSDGKIEAEVMKEELKKYGIPDNRIITETKSMDTVSEAQYCSKMLKVLGLNEKGCTKLVTNNFHIGRVSDTFKRYYSGNIVSIGAENFLRKKGERFELPNDMDKHPYGKFAEIFLNSYPNLELAVRDYIIRTISRFPKGEQYITNRARQTREK